MPASSAASAAEPACDAKDPQTSAGPAPMGPALLNARRAARERYWLGSSNRRRKRSSMRLPRDEL